MAREDGRYQVLAVIGVVVLTEVLAFGVEYSTGQLDVPHIGRRGFTLLLLLALYWRMAAARWIAAILLAFGAVAGLSSDSRLLLILGLANAGAALILLISPDVTDYFSPD
jgi:hypothetical protein